MNRFVDSTIHKADEQSREETSEPPAISAEAA